MARKTGANRAQIQGAALLPLALRSVNAPSGRAVAGVAAVGTLEARQEGAQVHEAPVARLHRKARAGQRREPDCKAEGGDALPDFHEGQRPREDGAGAILGVEASVDLHNIESLRLCRKVGLGDVDEGDAPVVRAALVDRDFSGAERAEAIEVDA